MESSEYATSSSISFARFSISLVIAGSAGSPDDEENFRPLYSGGLWLAVIFKPPPAFLRNISNAMTGVGVGPFVRKDFMLFPAKTLTASEANLLPMNRVS